MWGRDASNKNAIAFILIIQSLEVVVDLELIYSHQPPVYMLFHLQNWILVQDLCGPAMISSQLYK